MKTEKIPIHDFSRDGYGSVPFRYIPLNQRSDYDTSSAHRHNYFEIFLFAKGGGVHDIDFGSHPITDRSIHFVAPGMVHKLRREPGSFGSIILFSRDFYHFGSLTDMSLYEFPFLHSHVTGSPIVTLQEPQFAELLELSTAMGKEKLQLSDSNSEIIRTYLHIFLLKCKQYQEEQESRSVQTTAQQYQKLQHLLEKNYRDQHLPSFYADELGVSFKRLNEISRQNTGLNVSMIIRDRLLLEAKRLLLHTDHSIKEIGYFLGFDDPAYFNRFFRKNEQMSAGSFRRKAQLSEH